MKRTERIAIDRAMGSILLLSIAVSSDVTVVSGGGVGVVSDSEDVLMMVSGVLMVELLG